MFDAIDKTAHVEIIDNPDVREFLLKCRYMVEPSGKEAKEVADLFVKYPLQQEKLPVNIISIDGSSYEASISDNLPHTRVGYVKVGNILIKRDEYDDLGKQKYINPFLVAEMEKATSSTVFALPSSNMQYGGKESVRDGFRLALDNYLFKYRNNPSDIKTSLRTTLFKLASYRTGSNCTDSDNELILHKCPNSKCNARNISVWNIDEEQFCPECGEPIYPSDCLRIWEEVEDNGSNHSALTRFTNVIEHLFVMHYIRMIIDFSPESYVETLSDICFFMDGPLAIYGNAAWVHNAIMKYLHEINVVMQKHNKNPILIIGLVKSGAIVDYFKMIEKDIKEETILCLSDKVRNKYVNYDRKASSSTFGSETYYGQDFIYKAKSGKLIVFNLPYPFESKGDIKSFILNKSDIKKYQNLNKSLCLLNEFECDLYENTVVPVALARKHTVISLKPGSQVLDLLTRLNA